MPTSKILWDSHHPSPGIFHFKLMLLINQFVMNTTVFSRINHLFGNHLLNLIKLADFNKNNNLQIKKIIYFVVISLALISCAKPEEEITWNVNSHPALLVVDGMITNELKNQGVRLTFSNTYFSAADPLPVQGATVRVTEGSNSYTFKESPENEGWYFSADLFAGMPGKTYELLITLKENVNGQKEYMSSSTMPEGIDIDSIQCELYALPKDLAGEDNAAKDTTILAVYYFGKEPESPGNYYFAKIFRNNMPLFLNVKDYPFSDDSQRNGASTNLMAVIKNVTAKDTIAFNLFSVSKEYFSYIDAISKIDMTGNIYSPSGPPANAMGNVKGALGIFMASYVSSGKSVVIDKR
jgi:hypothetical protein